MFDFVFVFWLGYIVGFVGGWYLVFGNEKFDCLFCFEGSDEWVYDYFVVM